MAATRKAKRAKLAPKTGPYECSAWNGRVVLTHVCRREVRECHPTTDPHDRAHLAKFGGTYGELIPAANRRGVVDRLVHSTPRRYHLSQLVGWRWEPVWSMIGSEDGQAVFELAGHRVVGGVGFDSMFDAWWALYLDLTREGIPLGGLGSKAEAALAQVDSRVDVRLRDVLEPRTKHREDARMWAEDQLERQATDLLRRADPAGEWEGDEVGNAEG